MATAKTPPKEIYLAGGCFWGLEAYMKNINGVVGTDVGYANGKDKAPTYEEVCTGLTGHAETARIRYNPGEVSLKRLLQLFMEVIDPTLLNRQGADIGSQYRTGIYFTDPDDEAVAREVLAETEAHLKRPVVVEVLPLTNYFSAEEYHQDYLDKNPNGYCHIPRSLIENASSLVTTSESYSRPSDEEIKKRLNETQYHVAMENGTERPFQNEYWDNKEQGLYVDIVTGEPLFVSGDKYDSGCGWPSFTQPVESGSVKEKKDVSLGMVRTEVRSRSGNIHLGHVFDDGPKDRGGLRYCINSASLRFIPLDKMEEESYGNWIDRVKKSH